MTDKNNKKVINLQKLKVACKDCSLHQLCLPKMINNEDMTTLDRIIKRGKPLKRGDFLFNINDVFHSIYVVRSGSLKTFYTNDEGGEQLTGFYLPGELLGLDAIHGCHPCAAKALENTNVCAIPFDKLEQLSVSMPSLQHQLLRLMSKEISDDQNVMILLGKKSAESRLATYLLSIAWRYEQRGFSGKEFYLSMSRNDIANFLGLAVETISRTFSQFQEQGVLQVERRHIIINKMSSLRQLSGTQDEVNTRMVNDCQS